VRPCSVLGALTLLLLVLNGCDQTPPVISEVTAPSEPARAQVPEPVIQSVKAQGQLGPGRGTLIVEIKAPDGAELTEGAPLRVRAAGADVSFLKEIDTKLRASDLPARLPLDVTDGAQGPIQVDLSYYYCDKGDKGSCKPERAKLSVEIDMNGGAAGGEAHLVHKPAA
jgi:hypothetical protein